MPAAAKALEPAKPRAIQLLSECDWGFGPLQLETLVLNCSKCGLDVHWVSGLGVTPGRWARREPAPHGEPAV